MIEQVVGRSTWTDSCQSAGMDRDYVICRLRESAPELRQAGIEHLRLFGSVARDEAGPESDVDLIAEFDGSRKFSRLDMVGFENRLEDLLGARVELASMKMLKDAVRERALRESVVAF